MPDDAAFEELYFTQYTLLVRLAFATTGSLALAEELVQDAFVSLLGQDKVGNPHAWIRRAVISNATSWVRRRRLERRHEDTRPDAVLDTSVLEFCAALKPLPQRQRAALYLRYHDRATDREIADLLGCRLGTAKSLVSRGLANLRKEFDHD